MSRGGCCCWAGSLVLSYLGKESEEGRVAASRAHILEAVEDLVVLSRLPSGGRAEIGASQ